MADTFEITNIVSRVTTQNPGGITRIHQVTFKTKPSGLVDVVDIEGPLPSPEQVGAIVAPLAQNLEAVKAV